MAQTIGTLIIDMAANVAKLQADMQQARGIVSSTAADVQKSANAARDALGAIGVGLSVTGAIASIQQIGKALIDAEASAVKFKAAFTSISGAESVGRELEFVRGTARQLGLDLEATSNSYLKLAASSRGTTLEGQATRDIFTAVSKAATTLGLSSSEADGALLAVSQMMSKGTVQAEELRGQLGERLPGAFQIAARAMGVSTSELGKMLEAGQVIAEDFLPKFAKQLEKELGQASVKAAGTASREWQRLQNEFGDLVKTIANGGLANALGGAFGALAKGLAGINEQFRLMKNEPWYKVLFDIANPLDGPVRRGALGTAEERVKQFTALNAGGPGYESELAQAKADLARVRALNGSPGGAMEGGVGDDARVKAMQAEAKAIDELKSKYTALSVSLSGQHKDYQSNLAMLQAAREKGIISEGEYVAQVKKLTLEQGGVKDAIAARTKAETEAEKQAKKLNDAYFDALGISKDYTTKVRELETLQKTGRITVEEYALAIKKLAEDQAVSKDAVRAQKEETDKLKQAEKDRLAQMLDLSRRQNEATAAITKQIEEAEKATRATQEENAKIGLTKEAIGEMTAARWDDKAAMVSQQIEQNGVIVATGDEFAALTRLAAEYRRNAEEIRTGARLTAIQDEATKAKEAWDKQATDIGNSLTDALMRGFESGKDFGKNMADTLKNLFKTLILKPIIQPIAQNAAGSLMSLLGLGSAGTAAASTGGVAGVANSASALGGIGNLLSGGGGLASLFGAGTGVGGAATTFATSGLGTMLGLSETVGGVGVGLTGAGSSLVSGLSAIPGWGWALAGGVALLGILGKKRGGPKLGGSFSTTGERLFTPNGADSEAGNLGQSALAGISDLAAQLGGSASGLSLGLGFDSDPQGTAGNRIASFLRDASGRSIYNNIAGRDVGRDDAALQASLGDETSRLILAGLKAADLPTAVRDFLASVDLATVTSASMDAIIAQAKAIAAQEASWQPLVSTADAAAANAMGPSSAGASAGPAGDWYALGPNTANASALDGMGPAGGLSPIAQPLVQIGDAVQILTDPASPLTTAAEATATSTASISRVQEDLLSIAREQRDDQRTIGRAQAEANTSIIEQLNLMRSAFERINIVATMASVRPA